MSVVAEVYTLHTFFLALDLYILIRWRQSGKNWRLVLFAFLYALSLSNHTTGLFFAPGFIWLIVSSPRWKWKPDWYWLAAVGGFVIGLLVYLYIPLRAGSSAGLNYIKEYYAQDVTTFSGLLWMISGRAYSFFAFAYPPNQLPAQLWNGLTLIWRNFIGVGAILALVGVFGFFKRNWEIALTCLLIFLGNFIFYINYQVLDKDTMFLPSFVMVAFFIAAGISEINQFVKKRLVDLPFHGFFPTWQPLFWLVIVILAGGMNWRWADMSHTVGPETYSRMVLASADSDSTIIATWSPAVVLEYEQLVEGQRPDLHIFNQSRTEVAIYYRYWSKGLPDNLAIKLMKQDEMKLIDQAYQAGKVYAIEYDSDLAADYEYVPVGVYYQLRKR